jgi:hypothetical protein
MIRIPAHKQTDPAKKPGQIVGQSYKPSHGGYPTTVPVDKVVNHPYADIQRQAAEAHRHGVTLQDVIEAIQRLQEGRTGYCCNALKQALRERLECDSSDERPGQSVIGFLHPLLQADGLFVDGAWDGDGPSLTKRLAWMVRLADRMRRGEV